MGGHRPPQRLFTALWYRAESWPASRWVVVKCEAHAQGTNRRAVVTNRPGRVRPARGLLRRIRQPRRKREPQQGTQGRFAGRPAQRSPLLYHLFRLYLHTAAYNLLVRTRQVVVDPPPDLPRQEIPTEALTGQRRRDWHNRRRKHDPLAKVSLVRGARG